VEVGLAVGEWSSQLPQRPKIPRSLGLTLVTNNTRQFGRVSGLIVENWAV